MIIYSEISLTRKVFVCTHYVPW